MWPVTRRVPAVAYIGTLVFEVTRGAKVSTRYPTIESPHLRRVSNLLVECGTNRRVNTLLPGDRTFTYGGEDAESTHRPTVEQEGRSEVELEPSTSPKHTIQL